MIYELYFTEIAIKDIKWHKDSGNKIVIKKISSLIEELRTNPKSGTGKPEQLKHELSGFWSRRINQEHRLIYEIESNKITILSAKGHY